MAAQHKDVAGRLLRRLSLLQSRREWSGRELARQVGITDRTLRRDIARLRALDYPVTGTAGTAGGYRLASGRNLAPLLLDDDEAIAIAIGLATAAGAGVTGVQQASMRALAKLERVLPTRLRPQLAALGGAAATVMHADAPGTDPTVLGVLAACSRDEQIVSFDYRNRAGDARVRRVEPSTSPPEPTR